MQENIDKRQQIKNRHTNDMRERERVYYSDIIQKQVHSDNTTALAQKFAQNYKYIIGILSIFLSFFNSFHVI